MKYLLLLCMQMSMAQVYRLNKKAMPVWELGVGVGYANFAYYPGSSKQRSLILPVPLFVYRGKYLRADEEGGLRGLFLDSNKFEINISSGVNLPFNEDDTPVRKGMNEKEFFFEIGPGFIYHFIAKDKREKCSLSFSLNTRFALSSDFKDTRGRGFVFNPQLYSWAKLSQKVTLRNSIGVTFSTNKHQAFFYDVQSEFVNSQRSFYKSKTGIFGVNASSFAIIGLTRGWSVFTGLSYANYSNSANRLSPLHEKNHTLAFVAGVSFWFAKSKVLQSPREI